MSVLGIISEYNPFHNGHKYHLEESKKITNSQYSVCVMSGNFIQRGEPAIVDKWARTKMALAGGIDLVLELPVVYAASSAELFAYGGVKILDGLGIVDSICFGSESSDICLLDKVAQVLVNETPTYQSELKQNLDNGLPYAVARSKSLIKVLDDKNLNDILSSSNNILGIEYLKALKNLNSSIKPYTILRTNNKYNDEAITSNIASATSIRQAIVSSGNLDAVINTIPESTLSILNEEFANGKGPVSTEDFSQTIISILRKMRLDEIKEIFDVNEGLENKIKKSADSCVTINSLIDSIKSKRYTQTRIQRILYHTLIGINKEMYSEIRNAGGPQYIRVLGFNENGQRLLSQAKKKSTLPIITKVADYKNTENQLFNKMLDYDITATNLYALTYKNPVFRAGNQDFIKGVIR